jgi:imidazole glycerol-phosphate synthase subunit HisH
MARRNVVMEIVEIAIIDYSMGNLRSVANAFDAIGTRTRISEHPSDLDLASGIVLPGVGAFGDGIRNLHEQGWVEALERNVVQLGKPFLGLCLGMQLLCARGTEHGDHEGLGYVPGSVVRMSPNGAARIPHIGWNEVEITNSDGLYEGLGETQHFYFVHSYVLDPEDPRAVSGIADHGGSFVASVEVENVSGTQFHPEKSQKAGLTVLRNFARRC